MKICKKCEKPKDLRSFARTPKTPDGHRNICKSCDPAKQPDPYRWAIGVFIGDTCLTYKR